MTQGRPPTWLGQMVGPVSNCGELLLDSRDVENDLDVVAD